MLNYGPKRLVCPAVLRMPQPFMGSTYAKITFWRQTAQRLKRNDWTEGQCHEAQTRLYKIQNRSFLIPDSQIWIHYPHSYLPRRIFVSRHPVAPMASCVSSCSIEIPLAILEDSLCTSSQICAVKSTPPAASMFAVQDIACPLTLNASGCEFGRINRPNPSSKPGARHYIKGTEFGHGVSVYTKGKITLW